MQSTDDAPDGMAAYARAINNPNRDDPNWPLPSFDAKDWADAFHALFPDSDRDLMHTWFANALMRGYDEHARTHPDRYREGFEAAREMAIEVALKSYLTIRAMETPE